MWHEVILPRRKAKHRRLGSDLLHGLNRFGRFEANEMKNSCCLNKSEQRHGFSVLTLILGSIYISGSKVALPISTVESCVVNIFSSFFFFLILGKEKKHLNT